MELLDLYASLTLQTDGYETALQKADKEAKNFGASIDKYLQSDATKAGRALSDSVTKAVETAERSTKNAASSIKRSGETASDAMVDAGHAAASGMTAGANTAAKAATSSATNAGKALANAGDSVARALTNAGSTAAKATVESTSKAGDAATKAGQGLSSTMSKAFDVVVTAVKRSGKTATDAATESSDRMADAGNALGSKMADKFDENADQIERRADEMADSISRSTSTASSNAGKSFASISDGLKGLIGDGGGNVVTGGIGGAGGMLAGVGGKIGMVGVGLQVVAGLADKAGEAVQFAADTGTKIADVASKVAEKVWDAGTGAFTFIIDGINKISDTAATAGAVIGSAAVAACATVSKAAFDAYGDLEQLAGGIETLYGKGSAATAAIRGYAENAYSSLQMSSNDYMQNVMTFSARLMQDLDPEAAAEKANQALSQIADNYNKMGTNASTAMYAYQGLAKGNATMLDNLYLGYGGNNDELIRLLADSGVLDGRTTMVEEDVLNFQGKKIGKEWVEKPLTQALKSDNVFALVTFNEIIDAIGVIQDRLGMTGTAAQEASHTIQGSMNALKASWDNLVAGFGNPDADVEQLTENVLASLDVFTSNAVPTVERIVSSIGDTLETNGPEVYKRIRALVDENLPTLMEDGARIAGAIFDGIIATLPLVATSAIEELGRIVDEMDITDLATRVGNAIYNVAIVAADNAPVIIEAWYNTLAGIVGTIVDRIAEDPEGFGLRLSNIAASLADGFVTILETIAPKMPAIIDGVIDVFTSEENIQRFKDIGVRFMDAIATIFDVAGDDGHLDATKLGQKIIDTLVAAGTFLAENVEEMHLGDFIAAFVESLTSEENTNKIFAAGRKLLKSMGFTSDNIFKVIRDVLKWVRNFISTHRDEIGDVFAELFSIGVELGLIKFQAGFTGFAGIIGGLFKGNEYVASTAPTGTASSSGSSRRFNDNSTLTINNETRLDGELVAKNTQKYQQRKSDRFGT